MKQDELYAGALWTRKQGRVGVEGKRNDSAQLPMHEKSGGKPALGIAFDFLEMAG